MIDFHQVLDLDHHITFYNIYDHRRMSISYAFDDMQEKFFICMKKFENDFLMRKDRELDQNDESENRELDQNDESKIENLMKINHLNHQSKNRFRIFSYK
jgi:hypothetical protein